MLFVQRSGWAMVSTGNPYKELVACLMTRGVQIELCGAMAAVHNWEMKTLSVAKILSVRTSQHFTR
jgi:hypothetical protein